MYSVVYGTVCSVYVTNVRLCGEGVQNNDDIECVEKVIMTSTKV